MSTKVNMHIINCIDDISKLDLYHIICSAMITGNYIQIYLYGLKDKPWKKHLDEIMASVLIKYDVIAVELDTSNHIYDIIDCNNKSTNAKESFEFSIISSNIMSPLFISNNTLLELATKYNTTDNVSYIKFNRKDQVKYRSSKVSCMVHAELINMLKTLVLKYRPELLLTVLYVDQSEKQIPDSDMSKVVAHNKPMLSMFNKVLDTEVISCSIFTSYTTVEHLIKENTKDKPSSNIFIVLDTINRSNSVNPNNNSYYIPIDNYVTTEMLNSIYYILLKNIFKYTI